MNWDEFREFMDKYIKIISAICAVLFVAYIIYIYWSHDYFPKINFDWIDWGFIFSFGGALALIIVLGFIYKHTES